MLSTKICQFGTAEMPNLGSHSNDFAARRWGLNKKTT
ncbi:MAG: hypothetical protein ACI9N0_000492 [Ilumatobacter sp.]|jgi:hypothetical protein